MKKTIWLPLLTLGLVLIMTAGCTKDEEARKNSFEAKQMAAEAREMAQEALRIAREAKSSVTERTEKTFQDLEEGEPDLQQGQDVYIRFCAFCHGAGVAGAPTIGVPADWAARRTKGLASLIENSVNGIGHMPPRGGEPGLTDAALRDAVVYMLKASE